MKENGKTWYKDSELLHVFCLMMGIEEMTFRIGDTSYCYSAEKFATFKVYEISPNKGPETPYSFKSVKMIFDAMITFSLRLFILLTFALRKKVN